MQIPLIIGRNSNGEHQMIDLIEIPLLMISYCEEYQLKNIFTQLCTLSYPYKQNDYFVISQKRSKNWETHMGNVYVYYKDNPENSNVQNKMKLLKKVTDEISRRELLIKKQELHDFKKYHSLNTWKKEKITYQFFVVDDIWDIIISKSKSIGLSLMRIILYGPYVGIHTIFTSILSYRNLLEQLININPVIAKELQKKYGIPEPKKINTLGSELIITAENLVFYKNLRSTDFEKMYIKQ